MDEKACSRFFNASDFVNISIKTYRPFSHLVTQKQPLKIHQECPMLKLNVAEYVPIGRLSCAGPRPPKERFCYGGWCTENGW
jgi:hypothetical protein